MAKIENKVVKKAKGKKRKHVANENDDEVAPKSLIVESESTETQEKYQQQEEESTTKAVKRKLKNKSKIKEKRSKKADQADGEDAEEDIADEELEGPTLEELRESEKPENTKAIVTVRQKKKQQHLQRLEAQKDQSSGKEDKRNEEYLRKWKDARGEWKFEKLRQIAIQQSVFDEDKLDADVWPLALEYLSGSKGAAKEKITKLAEDVIDQLDKECGKMTDDQDDERQAIVDSAKYQRARDLLQSFD